MLATFVGMLGMSLASVDHLGLNDAACGEFGIATTSERVQTAVDGPLQHCPICHFFRTMNQATTATVASVPAPQPECPTLVSASLRLSASDALHLPSRGPPSPLTIHSL